MPIMALVLNWREIAALTENLMASLKPGADGLFVDKVVVPSRADYPSGYIKGEWAIRLNGRKQEYVLLFSARPRHPYLTIAGRGIRAASHATHSAFDLGLSKHLKGAKLL